MARTATDRLEFRVRPDSKSRIEAAAALLGEAVGEFARTAAQEKADRVLAEHEATTTVPAAFFDDLLAALDAPPQPSPGLAAAGRRARQVFERE